MATKDFHQSAESKGNTSRPYQKFVSLRTYDQIPEDFHDEYPTIALEGDMNRSMDSRVSMGRHKKRFGDFMTLLPIKTKSEYDISESTKLESPKEGMPVYFKDLRDDKYIIFRGFLDGLSEDITASWNEVDYLGRSESVFQYQKAARSIGFGLTLFAQSSAELDAIYVKLRKLSSLCYPQYKIDSVNFPTLAKTRMKPPLTKLRIGELFGNKDNELMGFIETLQYAYDDNSPWEIKKGKRVPKMIKVTIAYTVIHEDVPNMKTEFFGGDAYFDISHRGS
jgi:hypothetical protein